MVSITFTGLALCETNLESQLLLTFVWAVVWYLIIENSAKYIFQPWIASKPWKDQWIELNDKTFQNSYNINLGSKEAVFEFATAFLAIICQHAIGGLLCVPSVLGGSGVVVAALARHGGLCEAGWELQDVLVRAYQVLFGGEKGKAKNPLPLLILLGFHHAMGLSMVIPMNIMYGGNVYYHELVFLLQFAAFVACVTQNYGYTLDVKSSSGLRQMKVCVTITVVSMVYSRALRYVFVGYKIMAQMYSDGNTRMLCCGGLTVCLMGLLNILMVLDALGKFAKFMKMSHTDEDLQPTVVRMHSSFHRHGSEYLLSEPTKRWAKVRGAVLMGAVAHTQEKKKTK